MQIALSINAAHGAEARALLSRAATIVPAGGWVHIDVGDGAYTPRASWGDAAEFSAIRAAHPALGALNMEVHLMARDWADRIVPWLEAGVRRVIVPVALVSDLPYLSELSARYGCAAMLSFSPQEVVVPDFAARYGAFRAFQILAVSPGESGQQFDEAALPALRAVRAAFPDAILEVDGGVTPDVLRRAHDAGADCAVSSSFVWHAGDPQAAYEELRKI